LFKNEWIINSSFVKIPLIYKEKKRKEKKKVLVILIFKVNVLELL
jgi:hypothetical protein